MAASVQVAYMGSAAALPSVAAAQHLRSRRMPNRLTFSGIVYGALVHLVWNGLTAHPQIKVKQQNTLRLSYVAPIFPGCLIAFSTMYFEGGL